MIASSRPGTRATNLVRASEQHAHSALWQQLHAQHQRRDEPLAYPDTICRVPEPFESQIRSCQTGSAVAAEKIYGLPGWCLHHNSDILGVAIRPAVVPGAYWPVGGGWVRRKIMEHYRFSGDNAYLKQWFPIPAARQSSLGSAGRG